MTDKYKITKIETEKSKIPQRQAAIDGILPRYPNSTLISGASGSGKSNLLINLLTKEHMYGNFYHEIIIFSPTAGDEDDLYKALKLPKKNFFKKFTPDILQKIIDMRKAEIKKDGIEKVSKTSRVLIIMDDVIADKEFLNSKEALIMFALLRHYLCSVLICLQSYIRLPRDLRKNCNAMMIFAHKRVEVETLIEEITPAAYKKRDFEHVIHYCNEPKKDDEYPFLYINNHAKNGEQIRRNLTEIITKEKMAEILSSDTKK